MNTRMKTNLGETNLIRNINPTEYGLKSSRSIKGELIVKTKRFIFAINPPIIYDVYQ
jgi:hypothetical protein